MSVILWKSARLLWETLQTFLCFIIYSLSTLCAHFIPSWSDEFVQFLWIVQTFRSPTDLQRNQMLLMSLLVFHLILPQTHAVEALDRNEHNIKSSAIMNLRADSILQAFVVFWLALASLITATENYSFSLDISVGNNLRLPCLSTLVRHSDVNKLQYVPNLIIMANDTIIEQERWNAQQFSIHADDSSHLYFWQKWVYFIGLWICWL